MKFSPRSCLLSLLILAIPLPAFARERLSMDAGWKFHLGDPAGVDAKQFDYPELPDLAKASKDDTEAEAKLAATRVDPVMTNLGGDLPELKSDFDDAKWDAVSLPHDWVVGLPFEHKTDQPKDEFEGAESHGFKAIGPGENNIGWYRRSFDLPAADKGKSLSIQFDGVYRNSVVWLNGHCLGRNTSGYSGFEYDISSSANYGGKNELVVRVDASRSEGWFYEGAGIYRHVWLNTADYGETVLPNSVKVTTTILSSGAANIHVEAIARNNFATNTSPAPLEIEVLSPNELANPRFVGEGEMFPHDDKLIYPARGENTIQKDIVIEKPLRWSLESPKLYAVRICEVDIDHGNEFPINTYLFGIRTIKFDPNEGFFLNGKHVEIRGTCNHQDAAGVGSAIPDSLNEWRLRQLKKFGCNAIRTSHNPPTPELLDACDRLGILVMDETRKSGDYPTTLDEMRRLVIRDRNHPSVILWSIGNEENGIQGDDTVGVRVATAMKKAIEELDTTRPITAAMNGGWGKGFSHVIDVQGFNYALNTNTEKYHKEHPTQPMFGSEDASTVSTRGIYMNDKEKGYVSAYDVNAPSWACTAEKWVNKYHSQPYMAGAFIWTGFDYRGEPTPYSWPCINSHFGVLDTCGFFKDEAYYYQSVWTDAPMVHILPHWNWKPGQTIDVWAYTNGDEVELSLNGKSLGRQKFPARNHVSWKIPWEPGKLVATAFKDGKEWSTDTVQTAGPAAKIALSRDDHPLKTDGRDTACVAVQISDANGVPVPDAANLVRFKVTGAKILGVGNGDPSCHEPDKADQRSAFGGKCMLIIQSLPNTGGNTGPIPPATVTATSDGLPPVTMEIPGQVVPPPPSVP